MAGGGRCAHEPGGRKSQRRGQPHVDAPVIFGDYAGRLLIQGAVTESLCLGACTATQCPGYLAARDQERDPQPNAHVEERPTVTCDQERERGGGRGQGAHIHS
jgi:hypothetical protein